jgi:hypothetical protein
MRDARSSDHTDGNDQFESPDESMNDPHDAVRIERDRNRMLGRRSPVDQSESSLISHDYQPRTGGPELIASWPLGPAPRQREPGDIDWQISACDFVTLQKNSMLMPYIGPLDYTKIYLGVCGQAYVDAVGEELTVKLTNRNLSGKPYETDATINANSSEYFVSPMVDFAPETDEYENEGRLFGGYELRAKVSDGTGYIDQGTAVQLWSE